MKTIVIYHRSDFDGIFCREIARRALPDAELIGWDYGEPWPVVPDEAQLYMLDISVDPLMAHPRLIWIDHHATAIAKYPATIPGYRIDGVAACRLAWQWFQWFTGKKVGTMPEPPRQDYIDRKVAEPLAVRLAGEYDVWDKRDPCAELFQHGLRSQDLGICEWNQLLSEAGEDCVDDLLNRGRFVSYALTHSNASIIQAQGFTVKWEDLTFLCLNTARCNSLAFTAGLKPEHDACLGFNWNGRKWRVSLYGVPGKPDVDLAPIAVKYGGGGHKQACGFETVYMPNELFARSTTAREEDADANS